MKVNPAMLIPPLAVGGGLLVPSLTQAWEPNVGWVYFAQRDGETKDRAFNYDYTNRDDPSDPDNVDFPVNLIFWGDAAINPVKNEFFDDHGWCTHTLGNPDCISAWLNAGLLETSNDPDHFYWDEDPGVKTDGCAQGWPFGPDDKWNFHARLYAPDPETGDLLDWPYRDRLYSLAWNYYIIGTSHIDVNHGYLGFGCVGDGEERHGWNEAVEDAIAAQGIDNGYTVTEDYWNMYNSGDEWIDGSHYQTSDGMATFIGFK